MIVPHRNPKKTFIQSLVSLLLVGLFATSSGEASYAPGKKGKADAKATVAAATEGWSGSDGLVGLRWDPKTGEVRLLLPPPDRDGLHGRFILVESLKSGLGSNPVGLDRGQVGRSRLVEFRRKGTRVWIEQPNLGFRAGTKVRAERAAVEESFARSVLWSGEIVGEDPSGAVALDWTSYLTGDIHDVVDSLKRSGQGSFRAAAERSAVDLRSILVFPDNIELDVDVTWSADEPGGEVRAVTPTPKEVTLTQHVALVRLPDSGYRPREFDPRSGSFSIGFRDYAAPLAAPIDRRLAVRHRLRDQQPLVYYVDSGVPEPVRSALVEGASWWAEAFEAAGFPGVFRVEVLPEGVHPLDVRYNVIQWVHRQTRGWSYGGGVVDPRTGEVIKGHVNLGSLRVRQDRLLFEALLGVDETGSGSRQDPVQLALARIRQLSAHEVGHTLGLSHNFAASTYDSRASVMDYPAPWISVAPDGALDVGKAYGVGIGSWDRQAIAWLYTEFSDPVSERAGLGRILQEGEQAGRIYLTDADARSQGSAHPRAHLWDNGEDPLAELGRVFAVRRHGLDRFGSRNLGAGRPSAELEEVFVPLYLYHRYQLTAAARSLGGVDYRYAINGDGGAPPQYVPADRQRQALQGVLRGLDPVELDIPDAVLAVLAPRPPGHPANRETFRGRTSPLFDPLAAAMVAGQMALDELSNPSRGSRLEEQRRMGFDGPNFREVLSAVAAQLANSATDESARHRGIREALQRRWVERLKQLTAQDGIDARVRSRAEEALIHLDEELKSGSLDQRFLARSIDRFLRREDQPESVLEDAPRTPPGSPIGSLSGNSTDGATAEECSFSEP